jgi:3-methyladenine DNA glycosylase AlkD
MMVLYNHKKHILHSMSASKILQRLKKEANKEKGKFLQRFFKTGKGQYAEGDVFLGLTVPQSRKIAKEFKDLSFEDLGVLLQSKYHEARLIALHILGYRFPDAGERDQKAIYNFYLKNTKAINNWDLVDTSAPIIVGGYLYNKDRGALYKLVKSKSLWERRIAIVATYYFIRKGNFDDTLKIVVILSQDKEDLIHKATGWMLREVGKQNEKVLTEFLDTHCLQLPRTCLRYAIEKFPENKRLQYLGRKYSY